MRFKYIYQQFISHISIIIVAFLVLSLLFSHYVENLVYNNKTEELISYGKNILQDLDRNKIGSESVISQYARVLTGRGISFSLFDINQNIMPFGIPGPDIEFSKEEWDNLSSGKAVVVKYDFKRYNKDVSLVALPYMNNGQFVGGILLISPVSGSREMIHDINRYLILTVLIALVVSLLLSWFLSKIHVKRINRIQEATSLVASGDYTVHIPSSNFDEIGELAKDFNSMVGKINVSMEEIESLENRRRQFMADVSHEMRTPLTTISGVIEGIRNDMIPENEKEKGLQLVSKETKRLIRLVNENLDYEKIRSNQVKLFKEKIDLAEVLEIIKEQLEFQADGKNDQIVLDVEENVFVHADYDRLIQILINITKNSIQFTENGVITLRGKAGENESMIEIEDTGIGIDPAEIEKIWRRFYKADISRTGTPFGEFGLGLSIVKQLVTLHNGTVEVSSEKGKGTKFILRFPTEEIQA
ncbi:ATP-binding protein [Cytobacillus sp. Hz8]|uniref:ATP-binding protein n=1 Tax=Cytobacillus sp. Hz8 TaxID=3347168 RepID=UPI0035D7349A